MAAALDIDALLARLANHRPCPQPPGPHRRAAVLVPLRVHDGKDLSLILTRRAADLVDHAGQVAFPGGRIEPGDAGPGAAALREAEEELALAPASVRLVGRLDDMITITGFHVTPMVGLVEGDLDLRPDPVEVARVFCVPLAALLEPSGWEQRRHVHAGRTYRVWHFPYDGEDIWGVTGFILRGFIEMLWEDTT